LVKLHIIYDIIIYSVNTIGANMIKTQICFSLTVWITIIRLGHYIYTLNITKYICRICTNVWFYIR